MLKLNLTPEEEARLTLEARQRGIDAEECVRQLLREHLPPLAPGQATRALLQAWQEKDETDNPVQAGAAASDPEESLEGTGTVIHASAPPSSDLEPLPVLEGSIPQGWKDAIYPRL